MSFISNLIKYKSIIIELVGSGSVPADGSITPAKLSSAPAGTVLANITAASASPAQVPIGDFPVGSRYRPGIAILPYVYSFGINMTVDPGVTKVKFNSVTLASITLMGIDPFDAGLIDTTSDIKLFQSGDRIVSMNPSMTTVYTTITLASAYTDMTGWYQFSCTAAAGTLPANNASVTLVYIAKGVEKPMRLAMDLLIASRDGSGNVNGILDKDDNQIAGQRQAANYAALPTVATNPRETWRLLGSNLDYTNDGVNAYWYLQNKLAQVFRSGTPFAVTVPAASFTAAAATSINAGADIRLTSAGAHGLTAAVNVGQKIHVSAGTNWTPGLYTIKAIAVDVSGLVIDLEEPFVSGMGIPTITLAATGSARIPIYSYTTHAFTPLTSLEWDVTTENSNPAAISNKSIVMTFGSTDVAVIPHNAASTFINHVLGAVNNLNSLTSQRTNYTLSNASGIGTTTINSAVILTENTANALDWKLFYTIDVAGQWMQCTQAKLKLGGD